MIHGRGHKKFIMIFVFLSELRAGLKIYWWIGASKNKQIKMAAEVA